MSDLCFIKASLSQEDELNPPVKDLDQALPFHEKSMGFEVLQHNDTSHKSAILWRREVKIGLAENGGDPEQEGCYFKVNSVQAAYDFFSASGLAKCENASLSDEINDEGIFFIVAPDRLCYCFGDQ